MGYTHYWNVSDEAPGELVVEAGEAMRRIVAAVVEKGEPKLAGPQCEGPPMYGQYGRMEAGMVAFNGPRENDQGHESFIWRPSEMSVGIGGPELKLGDDGWAFWFCKTAQKPYDPVVACCLIAASQIMGDYIKVSSDAQDWDEFVGARQSEGWRQVNAMIGHPREIAHAEDAVQLYKRVFSSIPNVIPAFKEEAPA